MTHVIEALIPIKTGSGMNDRIHWRARARRAKQQRSTAWMVFARTDKPLPAVVTLVRMSAGVLDDDNLQGALKSVRDGVADAYGIPDNDSRITWRYSQERCGRGVFGVRVTIEAQHE